MILGSRVNFIDTIINLIIVRCIRAEIDACPDASVSYPLVTVIIRHTNLIWTYSSMKFESAVVSTIWPHIFVARGPLITVLIRPHTFIKTPEIIKMKTPYEWLRKLRRGSGKNIGLSRTIFGILRAYDLSGGSMSPTASTYYAQRCSWWSS